MLTVRDRCLINTPAVEVIVSECNIPDTSRYPGLNFLEGPGAPRAPKRVRVPSRIALSRLEFIEPAIHAL